MKKIIKVILRIVAFVGAMYLWLIFAYNTLDRSVEAQKATNGGYLPNKFSFIILAIIVFIFLAKPIVSKKLKVGSIVSKIVFAIFLLIGVYILLIGS